MYNIFGSLEYVEGIMLIDFLFFIRGYKEWIFMAYIFYV